MQIVQFENGKWAVRRFTLFPLWSYLDREDLTHYWYFPEHVDKYCTVGSEEEARQIAARYKSNKIIKIIRV